MHGNGYTGSMECFPKFMSPSFLSSFYHNYLPLNHRKSREAWPPLEEWSSYNGLSPFRLSLFFSMTISRRWVEELGAITVLLLEHQNWWQGSLNTLASIGKSPDSAHVRNSKPWRSRRRHQFGHHGWLPPFQFGGLGVDPAAWMSFWEVSLQRNFRQLGSIASIVITTADLILERAHFIWPTLRGIPRLLIR